MGEGVWGQSPQPPEANWDPGGGTSRVWRNFTNFFRRIRILIYIFA